MSISVIIPTYKRPDFLAETIRSVLGQTRLPNEILIGDDSPDDLTRQKVMDELVPASPVPIRYFKHSPSLGEAANIDSLYQRAACDLVLHLHDDDPIYPECIALLEPPLLEHPDAVVSFGLQRLISEKGDYLPNAENINKDYFRTEDRTGLVDGLLAGVIGMMPNNGYLIRTEVGRKIGYAGDGRGGYARDFYFGFRIGKLGHPFYFVNGFTAKCRITAVSESRGNPRADNSYCAFKILLEDLPPDFLQRPELRVFLEQLVPRAVTVAANRRERGLAFAWLFGPHYRPAMLSPKWIKRLLQTLAP